MPLVRLRYLTCPVACTPVIVDLAMTLNKVIETIKRTKIVVSGGTVVSQRFNMKSVSKRTGKAKINNKKYE